MLFQSFPAFYKIEIMYHAISSQMQNIKFGKTFLHVITKTRADW